MLPQPRLVRGTDCTLPCASRFRSGRPGAAPSPAPPSDCLLCPALATDTSPAPARPTHKRKLILASPRGRGPRPVRLGAAAGTGKQMSVCGSTGSPKLHGRRSVLGSSRREPAQTGDPSALPPTPQEPKCGTNWISRDRASSRPAELRPAPY